MAGVQDRQNHLSVSGREEEEIAVATPGTDLDWPRCRYPDACPCPGFHGRNVLVSRPPRGGYNPVGLRKVPTARVVFGARHEITPLEGCVAIGFRSCCCHTLSRRLRSRGNDRDAVEADLQGTPRVLLTFVARGWAIGVNAGVHQMNLSSSRGAGGASSLTVLWEDGERVLCRGWRDDGNGVRTAVLAVLSASEHPTPVLVGRLAHEYGLKDELDGRSAVSIGRASPVTRTWSHP